MWRHWWPSVACRLPGFAQKVIYAPRRIAGWSSSLCSVAACNLSCTLYTGSVTVQSAACYTLCNRAEHCSVWCALCIVQLTLGCSQQHFLILLLNTLVNSKQCTGTYGSCSSFRLLAKLFGSVPTAVPSFFHCAFQC